MSGAACGRCTNEMVVVGSELQTWENGIHVCDGEGGVVKAGNLI